ncbi:MAG TPA: FeoA family protein [Candidatus Cloacimonadota bacterium]|nr:FeoA family protein [Candidatus Cloacimonadota bacterium]
MNDLAKKMHVRLRHSFGKRHKQKHHRQNCNCLACVQTEKEAVIQENIDHRTLERGICPGVQVKVLRNEPDEPNLIIAVGDARYVIDRRIASRIKVAK